MFVYPFVHWCGRPQGRGHYKGCMFGADGHEGRALQWVLLAASQLSRDVVIQPSPYTCR